MTQGVNPIVSGRVDARGHLLHADPRLAALQLQAGGEAGGIIAVPQLAAIARLAQNLGILVSRNVVTAEGDHDLDLIVRAKPDGDEIALEIGGWQSLKRASARFGTSASAQADELLWECDDELKLTRISADKYASGAIGQSLDHLFHFAEDADGNFPLFKALALRERFSRQHAHLRDDEVAEYWLSALPIIDRQGRYHGWRGHAVKIAQASFVTQSVASARKAAPAQRYAVQLNASLRTPLERIIAQAGGISGQGDGPVDPHYVDYANDIAAAGRHLLGLVDDLADVESIETTDFKVDHDVIELGDVARRAANLLRVRAADQNVRIDVPFEDDALSARGDFRRILQILVNLIGNAVRYSPAGSTIWVRIEQEGDLAALVVADQGKGIPADAHEKIFEKFARLDVNEPGGTGLGLYISRRLARAMGGDISVDSAAGQGARFVLTLPLAD